MSFEFGSIEIIGAVNLSDSLSNSPRFISIPFEKSSRIKALIRQIKKRGLPQDSKVILEFSNLIGNSFVPIIDVYLGISESFELSKNNYAGSLGLYGLQEASTPGRDHDGSGMTVIMDVSNIFERLIRKSNFELKSVTLLLQTSIPATSTFGLNISRVVLYIRNDK